MYVEPLETRQRQGFELQTTFEWAIRDGAIDARTGVVVEEGADEGELVRLAYGPGATITRINKGLRRRANRTQYGFRIDPVSGYWAKNDDEAEETDPTASPRQWIVPCVRDRKNALLLQPSEPDLSQTTLTTLQHAMLRGIETVFQLEQGEILAEPMPTRDERNGFLLYEAAEGGAGVLNRLVGEPETLATVARQALSIMHFDVAEPSPLPDETHDFRDVEGTSCVAACYRCLMSYYNQPDHERLDRRDDKARELLLRISRARTTLKERAVTRHPSARPSAPPSHVDALHKRFLEVARAREEARADQREASDLSYKGIADRALELADTLCGYAPFGVAMTKEVMWSNLDAPSFEAAIHLENERRHPAFIPDPPFQSLPLG